MLYKYRGIKNFRYFTDIVLNNRLFAAPYFDLNDPMEGHYLYREGELDSDVRDLIKGQKDKLRLCSLSKNVKNELMWSHYAEGHRGVAVGVEVNESSCELRDVTYGDLPWVDRMKIHNSTARDILTHKLAVWDYEEEVRAFTTKKQYIDVTICEIILGRSMSTQDIGFIKKLIERVDPNISIVSANDT